MFMIKSSKELFIYEYLTKHLPAHEIKYEPIKLSGVRYTLKVDFIIDKQNCDPIYLEYSGMNFFKKYLKLVDILKNNTSCIVIFDDEELMSELDQLISFILNSKDISILNMKSYFKTLKRIDKFNEEILELR